MPAEIPGWPARPCHHKHHPQAAGHTRRSLIRPFLDALRSQCYGSVGAKEITNHFRAILEGKNLAGEPRCGHKPGIREGV